MKKTTKFISAFMAAILCFNLVSFSAFAAEPSATETSFSAADLATYNQELADFGLNDDEIQQLQNITTKIANATTMREVDALMESYHAILESTPLAAAKTITSYSGGTLPALFAVSWAVSLIRRMSLSLTVTKGFWITVSALEK